MLENDLTLAAMAEALAKSTDYRVLRRLVPRKTFNASIGLSTKTGILLDVETTGLDERTWIDNVGRPHSDELKVTETWHRVNHDIMEFTMTIEDPKMYTKPWSPLNKFRMRLQPEWFDIREMICSASEAQEYNKTIAEQAVAEQKAKANKK